MTAATPMFDSPPFDARAVLESVRDGRATPQGLAWFARAIADGTASDEQVGAFAMGVLVRGLTDAGRVALTTAMRDTGAVMRWDLPGPVVDKHSTGGVGDSTSLLLAPALACLGAYVPMVSGRGLGHTGGTLDKLEAIPGYRVDLPPTALERQMRALGCAIVGAGDGIAPADKRLYAVRDVTGTVESVDLITASILSKKLAAGLQALVLDVKVGSGAFLPDPAQAQRLARTLVTTATGAGCPTTALITDMDRPLMRSAGNALEIHEVIDALTGTAPSTRLVDLTVALGAEVLVAASLCPDAASASAALRRVIDSGAAAERLGQMIAAQGGPADYIATHARRADPAPVIRPVPAAPGTVARLDTRALGLAVVHLGGGRARAGDRIDPRVGLTDIAAPSEPVGPDAPLAMVHAATEDAAQAAIAAVQAAVTLGNAPPAAPLVHERVAP